MYLYTISLYNYENIHEFTYMLLHVYLTTLYLSILRLNKRAQNTILQNTDNIVV